MDIPSQQLAALLEHGFLRARDVASKAFEAVGSSAAAADSLLGGNGQIQAAIQAHVGAKLGSAAVAGVTSATMLAGTAGLIYVAVRLQSTVNSWPTVAHGLLLCAGQSRLKGSFRQAVWRGINGSTCGR